MQSLEKLKSPYNPSEVEKRIYEIELNSGYFNPDNLPKENIEKDKNGNEKTFTIIMPPPNANGSLHAGHALFVTIQDVLIRYYRMNGYRTLWLPGSDHAGFETQVVYEKILEKEGRSRFNMTREEFYQEVLDFTMKNKEFMGGQLKQLGASCDWSRDLFTLDEKVIKLVYNTFKKLYDDKLLYRGARIVNWCPKHQTSLSNLEVNYVNKKDKFYYFKYGPFVIGTVRPETKFGDKYVVMHPDDERYKQYKHGDKVKVEWINGEIEATIIKDIAGRPDFGSGVMTITPWHSGIDFEIAKRHNLDMEQIIDERGKLLPIAGEFAGIDIRDAREKIVEKLKAKGLLVKIEEDYEHEVPVCYKCGREIEPQVKSQWFIKMKPLAELALKALENKEFNILSEQHEKIFKHWMHNIQDWNISRQIAWGIAIPAKICISCDAGYVDIENKLTKCEKCDGELKQDADTFDTWFSSGQWPLATTGFPDSEIFKKYFPTSVMETGADILFFWVARMIMLSLYLTGKVPFENVYLHGMVKDAKGQKMSKSKGNVISPLDISEKYGTDALRMALIVNNAPGTDMNLDPKKVEAYKKFANKIWNAARFVMEKCADYKFDNLEKLEQDITFEEDKKIIRECDEQISEIKLDIENYRLHLASEKIYNYFWKIFCDIHIENLKNRIINNQEKISAQATLQKILRKMMVTIHPFMPFISEEIWSMIKLEKDNLLMITKN